MRLRVALIGLGGIGSNVAMALAELGVGTVAGVDFDRVELSNLNRGLYGPAVYVPDRYGSGWALVPHFVRARYYNRNYTLAALTGVLLRSSWRSRPEVAGDLRAVLQAGGSQTTATLLARLQVTTTKDGWRRGIAELAALLPAAGPPSTPASVR
jgi:oligoendopeptidase F